MERDVLHVHLLLHHLVLLLIYLSEKILLLPIRESSYHVGLSSILFHLPNNNKKHSFKRGGALILLLGYQVWQTKIQDTHLKLPSDKQ